MVFVETSDSWFDPLPPFFGSGGPIGISSQGGENEDTRGHVCRCLWNVFQINPRKCISEDADLCDRRPEGYSWETPRIRTRCSFFLFFFLLCCTDGCVHHRCHSLFKLLGGQRPAAQLEKTHLLRSPPMTSLFRVCKVETRLRFPCFVSSCLLLLRNFVCGMILVVCLAWKVSLFLVTLVVAEFF